MHLETFKKLPLGGIDRRALVGILAEKGAETARQLLAEQRAAAQPRGVSIAADAAVLILGGSNGITRSVALQLLFGEHASVYCVHYDSEKLQIGGFHATAMEAAATAEGLRARFFNRDATREATIEEVLATIAADGFRAVHLLNGIAAGATKRYADHGPISVKELDVVFDPVLQTPDFGAAENIRKLGLVDVEVATASDIERTNKFMGTSSSLWAEPLAASGLLVPGESSVAFCDYDFPPNDPVYAMGPLAGAKKLQRATMGEIGERFGVRTVRVCYPPMATTALGAIPGANLLYAMSTQMLRERGAYQDVSELGRATMQLWRPPEPEGELRLDEAFQACLPDCLRRCDLLAPDDLPGALPLLFG